MCLKCKEMRHGGRKGSQILTATSQLKTQTGKAGQFAHSSLISPPPKD